MELWLEPKHFCPQLLMHQQCYNPIPEVSRKKRGGGGGGGGVFKRGEIE
jgi:hypothetical protein